MEVLRELPQEFVPDITLTECPRENVTSVIHALLEHAAPPEMLSLALDAGMRGRKMRTAFAFNMLQWAGWRVHDEAQIPLYCDLARMEMLHNCSLIADDMIDGDTVRRGEESFHQKHGFGAAQLTQLLLITEALNGEERQLLFRDAARSLIQGECYDASIGEVGSTIQQSPLKALEVYLQKTSPLFGLATELIAMHAGRSQQECSEAKEFGALVGAYYQLCNDHYDTFFAKPQDRGTPDDTVSVQFSAPLALLIARHPDAASWLGRSLPRRELSALLELMHSHDVLAASDARIQEYAKQVHTAFPSREENADLAAFLDGINSQEFWTSRYVARAA